ncbi:TrkA C-terminal domain-containing protein, partial [Rhodothermus marinus]|uniref:TrkA C-terminal domain-containing protein n=1 Tax=Rhodothermus marinus TaxID=29549 RepID=UPI001FB53925
MEENATQTLPLFEAVVAPTSNLVGKTLREVQFREQYGGVVLGIQRQGQRIVGSLGRIPIEAGDLLLIEARNGFDRR